MVGRAGGVRSLKAVQARRANTLTTGARRLPGQKFERPTLTNRGSSTMKIKTAVLPGLTALVGLVCLSTANAGAGAADAAWAGPAEAWSTTQDAAGGGGPHGGGAKQTGVGKTGKGATLYGR